MTQKKRIYSKAAINDKNQEGSIPLELAAQNGHVGCVKALLDAGADINLPGTSYLQLSIFSKLMPKDHSDLEIRNAVNSAISGLPKRNTYGHSESFVDNAEKMLFRIKNV